MNHLKNKLFIPLLITVLLTACADKKESLNTSKIAQEELIFTNNPQPMDKKTDVYMSMARAVKYNTDESVRILRSKLEKPEKIETLIKEDTSLYETAKILNFAVINAAVNLYSNHQAVSDYLYEKSAENLALVTILLHKQALFSEKKVREIERLEKNEQRKIDDILKKQKRRGEISDEEEEYKKEIEAALLNLAILKQKLVAQQNEYALIVKAGNDKFSLEGRRFYELEEFSKKYDVVTFQKMAAKKRFESKFFQNAGYRISFDGLNNDYLAKYPETERLAVNGYELQNPLFIKELQNKATRLSKDLIDLIEKYKSEKNEDIKASLKNQAVNLLNIAILMQVEIDFNIVKIADFNIEENSKQISKVKKEVVEFGKIYRINNQNKIKLLNSKIELLNLEFLSSQIIAERAFALRALYFDAGLSPFDNEILHSKVSNISQDLKTSFNKDMVEMLSQFSNKNTQNIVQDRDWAKGDNWLEKLLENPGKNLKSDLKNTRIYKDAKFDKKKNMQLGSYKEKKNIESEWDMLQQLFPELKSYKPIIEKTKVNNEEYYRLVVHSPNGGLRDLCNKIINSKMDCLLR